MPLILLLVFCRTTWILSVTCAPPPPPPPIPVFFLLTPLNLLSRDNLRRSFECLILNLRARWTAPPLPHLTLLFVVTAKPKPPSDHLSPDILWCSLLCTTLKPRCRWPPFPNLSFPPTFLLSSLIPYLSLDDVWRSSACPILKPRAR